MRTSWDMSFKTSYLAVLLLISMGLISVLLLKLIRFVREQLAML